MAFEINGMLFPGGKRKALTLSYDDGPEQDRRLVGLLNDHQVKASFNLNSGRLGRSNSLVRNGTRFDVTYIRAEEIPSLYQGHEVATHGFHHRAMTDQGCSALTELMQDRVFLEQCVPYLVLGHAYPYGLYDENSAAMLTMAGISYARTIRSTHSFDLPRNFLQWDPTCHHKDPQLMELARKFCEEKLAFPQPRLFYLWGHAYEYDMDDNWGVIERFLSYVDPYKEDYWAATNIEIVNYTADYKRLIFSASGDRVHNPTATELWMESTGEIFRVDAGATVQLHP